MNDIVEDANKNVKKIIQKMAITYKDWYKILSFTFHTYRNTAKTSMGATLYSLVYEMKAVMHLEVEIPSLRV
jgi:hypothetical protein